MHEVGTRGNTFFCDCFYSYASEKAYPSQFFFFFFFLVYVIVKEVWRKCPEVLNGRQK